MNILVVGNVLKDVYLNVDTRTDHLEVDKNNTNWLDISFDASKHHFFNRNSSLGGAAISLEVLTKMGLPTFISGSDLRLDEDGLTSNSPAETYRYILIADGKVSYFTPSESHVTEFDPPAGPVEYLYIDRSANLSRDAIEKINAYLDISSGTKLIIYVSDPENYDLKKLIPRASLIFLEGEKELKITDSQKLVLVSEKRLSYQNIHEDISSSRVDVLTHLSVYSIAAATILGGFILGNTVEDSLSLAKINIENSRLNEVLPLSEMQQIAENATSGDNLELVAANLVFTGKGILAADESGGSIKKKFEKLNIPDTPENRRDYRNILLSTPDLEKYVNGVILFDETTKQFADNGQNYVDYLISRQIIPGIKVDQGLANFENSMETYTKGLENLGERLKEYYARGLRFAKWRAAFQLYLSNSGTILTPTNNAIEENCRILAEYALSCQSAGLVPIVEPELVYDGYYSIEQSADVTGRILDTLFKKLSEFGVNLRACILKVNMVIAGKYYEIPSTSDEVGAATAKVLKEHVPADLAGVAFLSGGQTVEQATENLAAVEKNGPFPWPVTFSFARALQDPALNTWAGDNQNSEQAKQAFLDRLIANTEVIKK